mmetsp:Transcript_18584/g.51186  ORF Transcript_18584/g.51186 Transcript_18584/m.51186 type:complete len:280 (+) Transcript_18584:1057-1896(+)
MARTSSSREPLPQKGSQTTRPPGLAIISRSGKCRTSAAAYVEAKSLVPCHSRAIEVAFASSNVRMAAALEGMPLSGSSCAIRRNDQSRMPLCASGARASPRYGVGIGCNWPRKAVVPCSREPLAYTKGRTPKRPLQFSSNAHALPATSTLSPGPCGFHVRRATSVRLEPATRFRAASTMARARIAVSAESCSRTETGMLKRAAVGKRSRQGASCTPCDRADSPSQRKTSPTRTHTLSARRQPCETAYSRGQGPINSTAPSPVATMRPPKLLKPGSRVNS